jgi:hypothetical protein
MNLKIQKRQIQLSLCIITTTIITGIITAAVR